MSAEVAGWLAGLLGAGVQLRPEPRAHGQAALMSAWRGDERLAWVKRYRDPGAAAREALAYEVWLPQVGWGHAAWLGRCPAAPSVIATRHAPGQPADHGRRPEHIARLGALLARLHQVPLPPVDLTPLADALVLRAEGWIGRGAVPPELGRRVVAVLAGASWAGAARVPCHRDVQLHNLLVGDDIVLLDFGQARPDLPLADLVKLVELPDVLTSQERALLLQEAGVSGDALDALERLRVLHGLGTWVWGGLHDDAITRARGRAVLDAALAAFEGGRSANIGA